MKVELIEGQLKTECPKGLEKTFVGEVAVPTHKVLRQFFEERLRGEYFDGVSEISERLAEWEKFAFSHGVSYLDKGFKRIFIEGMNIACPGGKGGPFFIGAIIA